MGQVYVTEEMLSSISYIERSAGELYADLTSGGVIYHVALRCMESKDKVLEWFFILDRISKEAEGALHPMLDQLLTELATLVGELETELSDSFEKIAAGKDDDPAAINYYTGAISGVANLACAWRRRTEEFLERYGA